MTAGSNSSWRLRAQSLSRQPTRQHRFTRWHSRPVVENSCSVQMGHALTVPLLYPKENVLLETRQFSSPEKEWYADISSINQLYFIYENTNPNFCTRASSSQLAKSITSSQTDLSASLKPAVTLSRQAQSLAWLPMRMALSLTVVQHGWPVPVREQNHRNGRSLLSCRDLSLQAIAFPLMQLSMSKSRMRGELGSMSEHSIWISKWVMNKCLSDV